MAAREARRIDAPARTKAGATPRLRHFFEPRPLAASAPDSQDPIAVGGAVAPAVAVAGRDVEVTVGAHHHVAQAAVALLAVQVALVAHDGAAVLGEDHAMQVLPRAPMAYLNLRLWREESPIDPEHLPELSAHGAPPGEVIHEALVDALKTLIVPGLRKLDVPTAAVERWIAKGAFTDRAPTELLLAE
jgi:hypothetical protein